MQNTPLRSSEKQILRGQIYFVFLDPVFGHEAGGYKTRPVVVLSINDLNTWGPITVVPGTSVKPESRVFKNNVRVYPDMVNKNNVYGNDKNKFCEITDFQCNQLRAIDKGRFIGRTVGELTSDYLKKIADTVKISLGLP